MHQDGAWVPSLIRRASTRSLPRGACLCVNGPLALPARAGRLVAVSYQLVGRLMTNAAQYIKTGI